MSTQNEALLKSIFSAIFAIQDDAIMVGASQENTKAWDSVTHVALITAIESEFDLFIDTADALALMSYEKILDYVNTH